MNSRRYFINLFLCAALGATLATITTAASAQPAPVTLLNVSYDPTRELYAKEFVASVYKNVPVLDTGARGSTITFVQRNVGDVLLAWENEAFLALKEFGADKFQVVAPSISILAEPTVAVVDRNVDKKGARAVATAYLDYLYSDEGQDIAGRNYYRPTSDKAKARYASQFPTLTLFTIDQGFGGWTKADKDHFADGASFDQIYSLK